MASSAAAQRAGSIPASGTNKWSASKLIPRVIFYILIIIILFYTLVPFYWAIRSSIMPTNQLTSTPVQYIPSSPTLEHFQNVFRNRDFQRALINSAIVSISVTLLALVVGSFAAYALGRFKFKGRTPVLYLVLSLTMFPQIAILGSLFNMINQFGLYNKLGALVLTYLTFTLPFTVWVLTSFFRQMPAALEEAAYVDGATPFQTFYKVLLPLAGPGLVTTGLLAFIGAWNEFLFAISFTQTPEHRTVPVAIASFSGASGSAFEVPWGSIMAAIVVVTVPIVILVLIFQRKILAGLTAGAVKG